MVKLIVFLLFCASAFSQTAPTLHDSYDHSKGSGLFHSCQAAIRYTEATENYLPSDKELTLECMYYIQGFVEGKPADSGICIPTGTSWDTVMRLYVQFMSTHPIAMDSPRNVGLVATLLAHFPCKTPDNRLEMR